MPQERKNYILSGTKISKMEPASNPPQETPISRKGEGFSLGSDPELQSSITNYINYDGLISSHEQLAAGIIPALDFEAKETTVEVDDPSTAAVEDPEIKAAKDREKKRMRRFLVSQEIYETEKGYVNDLNNLVRNFFDALNSEYLAGVANSVGKTSDGATAEQIVQNTKFGNEGGGGWLTFDQKQAVVRNSSHVLRVQKLFFKMLEDACKTPTTDSGVPAEPANGAPVCADPSVLHIARCFITMMPKLEAVYLPFCSQHDTAIDTLGAIRKVHPNQLQAFFDDCRAKMNTKLEISDFLIKPIQRICRYPLLMKELLKSVPEDSADYAEMIIAMDQIKVLVGNVNESKKQAENERRKNTILNRLTSGPVHTIRSLGRTFGMSIDPEAKSIPTGILGDHFRSKLGTLMRGGGLNTCDRGVHELPFNTDANAEHQYLGVFLFSGIMFVLEAKKSSSYPLIHYILPANIVSVQVNLTESETSNPIFKGGWRITWSTSQDESTRFRTVDFAATNDKDKDAWIDELMKLVSADKLVNNSADASTNASDSNSSVAKTAPSTMNRTASGPPTSPTMGALSPTDAEFAAANLAVHTDLKFADVYTADSMVANAKVGGNAAANQKMAKASGGQTSLPSSQTSNNGTLKGLFRKSSFSRPSVDSGDRSRPGSSASANTRRPSASSPSAPTSPRPSETPASPLSQTAGVEKLAEVLKMTAVPDSGKQDQQLSSSRTEDSDLKDPTALGASSSHRRGSVSDMANAVKSFVRTRSNSIIGDKNGSKLSLNGDQEPSDQDKKMWGKGMKAKILTVGKFSAISKRTQSKDVIGGDGGDLGDKSDDARKSNSSLAPSVADDKGKKNLFTSLGRSFSKRRANSSDTEKSNVPPNAAIKKPEEPLVAAPPARPPPSRPAHPPPDRKSVGDASAFTYKPAPPPSSGSEPSIQQQPKAAPNSSRIAAIRAKRTSKNTEGQPNDDAISSTAN
eukprot:Partr_v1_DN28289_c3_g1_i1_m75659 putative guanine nucleotide exchange factor (GEF)